MWDTAEAYLRQALSEAGVSYQEAMGEAAYYGPKIDVQLNDVMGHGETLSTVQLDFYLPERFELEYVDKDGQYKRPVMIHRGVISTMERMMAFLIEHYAGNFPLWLAPVQVRVLTVTDDHKEYAKKVFEELRDGGWRVQLEKIPYAVVIGDKEVEARTVAPRRRGGENLAPSSVADFVQRLRSEVAQEPGEA
jgi:threonyl-tRNA synthetase